MKKSIIAIIMSLATLFFVVFSSYTTAKANEDTNSNPYVIDTEPLPELLTDEQLSKLYTCKDDIRIEDSTIIEINYEDAIKLMKVGQAEAGELDAYAIAYVMKVIINRKNDPFWPNTIDEILSQENQFSVYNSKRYEKTVPNVNAHYALYLIESGQITIEAEYFEAVSVKDSWQSKHRDVEFEYGGHRFYK